MKKSQSAALTRRLVLFVSACNAMRVDVLRGEHYF